MENKETQSEGSFNLLLDTLLKNKASEDNLKDNLVGASFVSALEALWANRLRSLLTSLGIVIGVAAVIAAITLTQGASMLITGRLSRLGANVITIYPGVAVAGGVTNSVGTAPTLTLSDAMAIGHVPYIVSASPVLTVAPVSVAYNDQAWNTRLQGVYPSFQRIQNWQIASGRWFSQDENDKDVVVIGSTVATNLFAKHSIDPLGQTIRVNDQNFSIVGVLQAKGTQSTVNPDDIIFAPLGSVLTRLRNTGYVDYIQAQVDDASHVTQAQKNITDLLARKHHIQPGSPNDFLTSNANQLLQTAQQFAQTLTFLLIGIAAISLTVGGIGIMNIMLVSVTQRIREIGLRMAIGARRRDVRNQFLIEALTLSVVGGILGIIVGLLSGLILTHWLSSATGQSFPLTINPFAILLAFGISAVVGVAFGFYPAVQAAKLDPIVALRKD